MSKSNAAATAATTAKLPGFMHAKSARASARKVLGEGAVEGTEFEVFDIEGGRFDWRAIEQAPKSRRTSKGKGKPAPAPAAEQQAGLPLEEPAAAPVGSATDAQFAEAVATAVGAPLGHNFSDLSELPTVPVTAEPVAPLGAPLQAEQPAPAEPEPAKPSSAASAFGAAAFAALSVDNHAPKPLPRAPKPVAEKKTRVPAEVKNGIRKPQPGTVCRAVWDAIEEFNEREGRVATSKDMRKIGEEKGWNQNNVSIEFYAWRKFNGISGRAAKPAEPKAE